MGRIIMSVENTDRIFDGTQPLLFLNRKGRDMVEGDTICFCERGSRYSGKVVGEAKLSKIKEIPRVSTGTYVVLPYYVSIYGNEEDKETVRKAMSIQLDYHDNALVLCYLYQNEFLDYMKENHKPRPVWPPLPCSSEQLKDFIRASGKGKALCEACDSWAEKLGFYDKYGRVNCNYILELKEAVPYAEPVDIKNYSARNGKFLTKEPKNWRYIK